MTVPSLLSQQDDFEQLRSATPIDFGSLFIWEVISIGLQNQPDRLLETTDEKHLLNITTGMVKSHVRNILKKLCVHDRTQAAIRALRAGFVH